MPIQIILGGAGAFLLYKLFTKNEQDQANALLQSQNSAELNNFLKKYKLSFNPSQYSSMANTIYEGTKYGLGDNYPAVVATLKLLKNDADVAMLVKTYGSRQNYIFGIPQGEKRDLLTNIKKELGSNFGFFSGHIDNVNKDWQKKGITYIL